MRNSSRRFIARNATRLATAPGIFVALAVVLLWHPARVAIQALLLLPALFPSSPVSLLDLATTTPSHEERTLTYTGGSIHVDLFQPQGVGRRGAVVLLQGAGEVPRSDLALHFSDALARSGIVTMVANSDGMLAERLTFDEVDAIRAEVDLLDSLPSVDPGRVGVIGLSAAGGISIVAAGQPDLRDRIRFVNSFGSYHDAARLLVDVASQTTELDGVVQRWVPEQRTYEVVAIALIDSLANENDRSLLSSAFLSHADVDLSALTPEADGIRELLSGTTRERAVELVALLPKVTRERLQQISPSTHLESLAAHLYLMHDADDPFIPIAQSRELVADAPPSLVQRYTEFSIFAHVIPEREVAWQTFVPDVWRLFWHVHAVLLELL